MSEKIKLKMFLSFVLISLLILGGCGGNNSLNNYITPTFSLTPSPTRKSTPSATAAATATPALNNKIVIITPDDLFALPGLKALSTPDSSDFCEHLPPPQIVTNPDRLSLLSGRFVLCIRERINIAMDLDTGSLIATDDERGDITMVNAPGDEEGNYGVVGWNNANLSDAFVLEEYANHSGANHLSYAYCENLLGNQPDRGAMGVEEGAIACVKTTEGKIALIRVEKIYPPNTLSAEFSFVVLREQ